MQQCDDENGQLVNPAENAAKNVAEDPLSEENPNVQGANECIDPVMGLIMKSIGILEELLSKVRRWDFLILCERVTVMLLENDCQPHRKPIIRDFPDAVVKEFNGLVDSVHIFLSKIIVKLEIACQGLKSALERLEKCSSDFSADGVPARCEQIPHVGEMLAKLVLENFGKFVAQGDKLKGVPENKLNKDLKDALKKANEALEDAKFQPFVQTARGKLVKRWQDVRAFKRAEIVVKLVDHMIYATAVANLCVEHTKECMNRAKECILSVDVPPNYLTDYIEFCAIESSAKFGKLIIPEGQPDTLAAQQ